MYFQITLVFLNIKCKLFHQLGMPFVLHALLCRLLSTSIKSFISSILLPHPPLRLAYPKISPAHTCFFSVGLLLLFFFPLFCSRTNPVLSRYFQPTPVCVPESWQSKALLHPALSWGLINLLKSQSAFHSITLIWFDTLFPVLGGIRMITIRIRSRLFRGNVAVPIFIMMQWWRTRPLAQVGTNWIITRGL